jgi:hypothetical protein
VDRTRVRKTGPKGIDPVFVAVFYKKYLDAITGAIIMQKMDKLSSIKTFLSHSGWISGDVTVVFLAAGEYNENFLVTERTGEKTVFRINHGSQLGLPHQIEYEFFVLKALESSGVTPKPMFYDSTPEGIDGGVLLMEFLPGLPLHYEKDAPVAADIFSKIHQIPVSSRLVVQENPILDIAKESYSLINRFSDHPLKTEKTRL